MPGRAGAELPPRLPVPQRRHRDPYLRPDGALPDDLRGFLRASQRHPAGPAVASVALSAQVQLGGALGQRGRLGPDD